MNEYRTTIGIVAAVTIAGLMVVVACGKKSDPPGKALKPSPAITGLAVEVRGASALLTWDLPGGADPGGVVRIYRAILPVGSKDCPSCPQCLGLVGRITVESTAKTPNARRLRFVDDGVAAGNRYRYRLLLCGARGQCGDAVDSSEISIP